MLERQNVLIHNNGQVALIAFEIEETFWGHVCINGEANVNFGHADGQLSIGTRPKRTACCRKN